MQASVRSGKPDLGLGNHARSPAPTKHNLDSIRSESGKIGSQVVFLGSKVVVLSSRAAMAAPQQEALGKAWAEGKKGYLTAWSDVFFLGYPRGVAV